MATNNPAHIILRNVRLSYVHILEPYAGQAGGEPKYSATVLVPKTDTAAKAAIDTAVQIAAQRGREKFGQAFPATPKVSVHDGDGVRASDGQPFGEECKGHWVFTASNKQRPGLVGGDLQPIMDAAEVYGGMYANVSVTFFPYNAPQNRGIGVALDNVQKIADGEPLGNAAPRAEDEFGAISAPAASAYSGLL